MITVTNVIEAPAAGKLQPAAELTPEIRAQLFDEFASYEQQEAVQPVNSQAVFFAVVLAGLLAYVALYIFKHVKPDEL
jgi:hypothetical protein